MPHADGMPIWFELTSSDQNAAADFYRSVMDWRVDRSPMAEHGGYLIAGPAAERGVAGIMTPPPGAPAGDGWRVYFAAHDVDAAAARVAQLGGAVQFGPMDIPHVGRFAVVSDPAGVVFSLMAQTSGDSAAFRSPGADTIGHGVWVELATPDPDGAFAFYGALFGWDRAGALPMGDMGEYAFIGAGEARPGAIMSSAMTGAPARWNWYVHVADIDAAIGTATAAGGRLIQGPDQIPGGDYSANLLDPQGAAIGIVGPRTAAAA